MSILFNIAVSPVRAPTSALNGEHEESRGFTAGINKFRRAAGLAAMKRLQFKTVGEAADIGKLITAATTAVIHTVLNDKVYSFILPSLAISIRPAFAWKKTATTIRVSRSFSEFRLSHQHREASRRNPSSNNSRHCAFFLLCKHDARRT